MVLLAQSSPGCRSTRPLQIKKATVMLGSSQAEAARLQAEVAKQNWQTENERVVLELFDCRIAIFEAIRHVVAKTMSSGQPDDGTLYEYAEAIEKAPFYFGPDVNEYLERIRIVIIDLMDSNSAIKLHDPAGPKLHYDRMNELNEYYRTAPKLFGPYIQAHQKVGSWQS
ncbi:hypothetical protein IVA94_05730 [Bradyrhizobium sp. 156]|uniref:hypothetical protein n=1 Tax=Bradyrhizobium sp. 156 TaxID=2782630 RepID=UPI001FF9D3BD|nr:hypothetical protein [Bradyrhizobium sp. 156]MCK1320423.1 hypothetical protein [Bradyrhizobium sp. 156]